MTNKQKEIYDWLYVKPSYIKKSAGWLYLNTGGDYSLKDYEIALKQARRDFPNSYNGNKSFPVFEAPKVAKNDQKQPIQKNPVIFASKVLVNHPKLDPNNVLVIGDTHEPFCKEGYLKHCLDIQKRYNCGTVVHIGDEVDLCAISQWEKDPDGFSAGTEAELAQEKMKLWYKAFPNVHVCIGNHTARPFRMAKSSGIPKKFIKSYEEAWEAPSGWKWKENWEINGVLYTHGTGFSGANAAIRIAAMHRQNTVIGHIHSEAGIQYNVSKKDIIWGMQVGGAINDRSYAAYYAKDQLKKSIIGCGVVINGTTPIYEYMKL